MNSQSGSLKTTASDASKMKGLGEMLDKVFEEKNKVFEEKNKVFGTQNRLKITNKTCRTEWKRVDITPRVI